MAPEIPIENAVVAERLAKSYGSFPVLTELKMRVAKGSLYGLLGPSGCGKTTLLRCIIGRLQIDGGYLSVLGKLPGLCGHRIPGNLVGYMPQEIALFEKFNIAETLSYFGRLHGMEASYIKDRTRFLINFLRLPEKERLICNLSGGQKRRVSFAIALLQEPELVILDEPTVGVDPLLRERIWEHLLSLTKDHSTTVIITTHYIEEAKQANRIGLMRNGRLLAEAKPEYMLERFETESLEEVFLRLCEIDQGGDIEDDDEDLNEMIKNVVVPTDKEYGNFSERQPLVEEDANGEVFVNNNQISFKEKFRKSCEPPKLRNILALIIKNFLIMRRNIGFLMFQFLLPSIQIILFCLCIGQMPKDLPMAVVNNETSGFSTVFLQCIDTEYIVQKNYSTWENAVNSVHSSETWGIISMGVNFTQDFMQRFQFKPPGPSNATLDGGSIHLYLDMTNQQILMTIQQKIEEAFIKFGHIIAKEFGMNPGLTDIPIKIEQPIYGSLNPSFTAFMAPGIIISIPFFMATGLTALSFVLEQKLGLLDRSLVAAVSALEIMVAHICTQVLIMLVQTGLLLLFSLLVFNIPYEGPLILVILLTIFQGLCGMALGLLISAVCEEENSAIQCALGSVYPNLLLSGIIWPIEAIPFWLRYVSICLPMTYASEAMRSILSRGWDMTYMPVWRGFLVTIAWGWGLMALSVIFLRRRMTI